MPYQGVSRDDLRFPYSSLPEALQDADEQARLSMYGPHEGLLANLRAEHEAEVMRQNQEDTARGAAAAESLKRLYLSMVPVVGPSMSAQDAVHAAQQGDWVGTGLGALGALPLMGIAGTFAGVGSKTANMLKHAQALKMAEQGASRDDIWRQTGWFTGKDGKWRYEIPDTNLDLRKVKPVPNFIENYTTGELEPTAPDQFSFNAFTHPQLKRAYDFPESIYGKYGAGIRTSGSYGRPLTPEDIESVKAAGYPVSSAGVNGYIEANAPNAEGARSALLHELSHGVQYREGFAEGGSPKGFTPEEVKAFQEDYKKSIARRPDQMAKPAEDFLPEDQARLLMYNYLAGETEARNVPYRDYLLRKWLAENPGASPKEWMQNNPPWSTQDIPDSLQIVRYKNAVGDNSADQIFAGQNAKTANLDKLTQAQEMAKQGASRDDIWQKTGWFQGTDQQWRFEIPDNKLQPRGLSSVVNSEDPDQGPTSFLFRSFTHPELKRAYPITEKIFGKVGYGYGGGDYSAPLRPEWIQSLKDAGLDVNPLNETGYINAAGNNVEQARSVLAHELQHGVQMREGFAIGGSPRSFTPEEVQAYQESYKKTAASPLGMSQPAEYFMPEDRARMDLYKSLAGETEARNVESRLDMTPEQRMAKPPWETESIKPQHQLIKMPGWDTAPEKFYGAAPIAVGGAGVAGAQFLQGKNHVDDGYYNQLSQVESGGRNIGSDTSSAFGPYQITEGTWADIMRRHPDLGLTEDDRTNPEKQHIAIQAFTQDNANRLQSVGLSPTKTNLYMTHFLGAGDGPVFLKAYQDNPNAPAVQYVSPDAVAANRGVFLNPDGTSKTLGQVYGNFDRKFSGGNVDAFQDALSDFQDHIGAMRSKYTSPQGGNGAPAAPGAPMAGGASPTQLDPKTAMLMALLRPTGGQTLPPMNAGGIPTPNYAGAGSSNGTSNLLRMMMANRQQSNLLGLLANSGAAQ